MKDIFGYELYVGDTVAVPIRDEVCHIGTIVKFCDKTIKVKLKDPVPYIYYQEKNKKDIIYRYPFMCAKYILSG